MTNYEKITTLPLEIMARKIFALGISEEIPYCKSDCGWTENYDIPDGECVKCVVKWLEEEASSDYKTVIECCNHCGHENELRWNLEDDGWQIHCAFCGEKLMLCSECLAAEDNPNGACPQYCFRKKLEEAE